MTKDEATLEEVYEIVRHTVAKQCKSVERFGEEAEDIVQEVMIKITQNWDQYKGDCKVSSWVYSIVRNTIINIAIKHNREKRKATAVYSIEDNELDFEDETYEGVEEIIDHDAKVHRLIELVESELNEEEQKVFRGVLKGYSNQKISDVFGIPYIRVSAISQRIKKLRL